MNCFTRMLCTGIMTTLSLPALADTYNKEIALGHTDTWNSEDIGISGTYYFSEVDDSLGPLAEAFFLSPQSSVGLYMSRKNTEQVSDSTSVNGKALQGFFGTWHSDSGLYLGGHSYKDNTSRYSTINDPTPDSYSSQWTSGHIGYYLNDSTNVWWATREYEFTSSGSSYQASRLSLGIQHLMTLDDSHLQLRAVWFNEVGDSDYNLDKTVLDTRITYYPAKNIGLRFGRADSAYSDGVYQDYYVHSFATEYFITPTLSLDMSMDRTEWSEGDSGRSQKITLTTRF